MHSKSRRIIPVVLLVVALAAFAIWYFAIRPNQDQNGFLTASGTIEVVQVNLGPEIAGKVVDVSKQEGDQVFAGEPLIVLDTTLLEAQRAQAEAALEVAQANAKAVQANAESAGSAVTAAQSSQTAAEAMVDAAKANLDLLEAGATPEQLAAASAQLAQAEDALQAAKASFTALTAGARPEDIDAIRYRLDRSRQEYYNLVVVLDSQQVEDTRTAAMSAETNLKQAQARQETVKDDDRSLEEVLDAADAAVVDAQSANDEAQAALTAVEDEEMPFYTKLETVRKAWEAAQLYVSQAESRKAFLNGVADIPQAALDDADAAVEDAQAYLDDIKAAYDGLKTSDQGDQLKAAWDECQLALSDLNRLAVGSGTSVETALEQLDAAADQRDLASANYDSVKNGARAEQIAAAQAQVDSAEAQLAAAQAGVTAADDQAKAAQSQAEAALAQVKAAQAAIDTLDVQIGKMTLVSPVDGVVLTRAVEPGEIVLQNATLLSLARVEDMTITVYIPEDRYGEVTIGQTAVLTADSFPGVEFQATVVSISDQAEFTPRNVQTVEGRKSTVFAVKLSVEDPSGRLKAGMPADVAFE